MKVLHVTPSYAPTRGGVEAVVEQLSRLLIDRGVQSDVLHVEPGLTRAVRYDGDQKVTTLPLFGLRLAGYAPGLAAQTAGYDLVHVHDPRVAALSLNLALGPAGPPRILSTHGGFQHTTRLPRLKAFHRAVTLPWLMRDYRLVIAISHGDQAFFAPVHPHVVRLPNGVDVSRFAPLAAAAPRPLDRWLCWGRLSLNKRLDRLIALVAQARAAGRTIDLLICGDDFHGLAPDLRRRIAEAGLESQITLSPGLGEAELAAEIRGRGVFVTASEYEGFGLTVIEAMAAGLIVACRDIAPLNEFVAGGETGVHFAFDDSPGDLAAVIGLLDLSPDGAEALRRQSQTVVARNAWSTRADACLALYETALTNTA
jgi:alpha-1,3-mannosyltransferase